MPSWLCSRKKASLVFRDTYWNIYRGNGMISGTCFKVVQEQGVGRVTGEYRSKKIGHVVIIIEAGCWVVRGSFYYCVYFWICSKISKWKAKSKHLWRNSIPFYKWGNWSSERLNNMPNYAIPTGLSDRWGCSRSFLGIIMRLIAHWSTVRFGFCEKSGAMQ